MLPMQMVNMFGAVRPKAKERVPYGDSRKQAVPTPEEAKKVLQALENIQEPNADDQARLVQVREILGNLVEGNAESFLRLGDTEFEDHNGYIAERIAEQQIATLESQAKDESQSFLEKNAAFFDHLRDEGMNYDHLSEEQVQVMRLRLKERKIAGKLEKNASHTSGEVFYQYALGPDDRYYKSGGVVLRAEDSKEVDEKVASQVLDEVKEEDFLGQFADVDALSMPSVRRSRSS